MTIGLSMSKAIISVTIIANKCIDQLWKTDIGTVEYSIAATFRSTCTDTILYRKYGTVPYNFLFTLIQIFQRIIGIEWIMISCWQYGLCTELYHSAIRYRTVRYGDIKSLQTTVTILFVNLK